jgi:geranylgeranyl reductase family protein
LTAEAAVAGSGGNFDVIVVGGGPAGAHAGRLLAEQGRTVAIIDRGEPPRDKVCGGGLTRKAVELLGEGLDPVVHRWIKEAELRYLGGWAVAKAVEPVAGCTVVRREFDAWLLERAAGAGARFFPRTRFEAARALDGHVLVRTDRGEFTGRVLMGADGVASGVRAGLFGARAVRYAPALEALVPLAQGGDAQLAQRALFDFGAVPHGYGWIFPKRDHLNVGVYSPQGARRLRAHLETFIERATGRRPEAGQRYLGYPIPTRNPRGQVAKGRAWLLGDAAGLADGVFGEGIYFALKSAVLAARALAQAGFEEGGARYSQLVGEELLPELRASRWLGRALYAFPFFSHRHLVANPAVNDDFAGLISGAVGYRECLWRTARRAPRWLFASAGPARGAPSGG